MNKKLIPSLLAAGAALPVVAQTAAPAQQLDPVVVTAERTTQTTFDAPAAITAIGRDVIENGGPGVNLSEALNRVPGITVLNRQNYAQDLQLSIRGFGSRSTFGIRGVRLIVDGIPATMPDGQGQASNIALGSTQRIEVLRGPLAQLYGNAAGGVVQVFSGTDAEAPTVGVDAFTGPYGQTKFGVRFGNNTERDSVLLEASRFRTDGYRVHSAAQRDQVNGKWEHRFGDDGRISVVVNSFDMPLAQDPAGLLRSEFETDPRKSAPNAITQDARKTVAQQQIGSVYERKLGERTTFTGRVYFGARSLDNALTVPPAAQNSNTSAGGIVAFERSYQGLGAQLEHRIPLGEGQVLRVTGGIEYDTMDEDRQGFINTGGVQGALKRDEANTVSSTDVYAQAAWDLSSAFTATAGARSSKVKFRTRDFFVRAGTPNNGDDSGSVEYSATNPVVGITWHANPALNVYANAGRGFETPTFTELAYRPGASGMNFDLRASRSRHAEVGAKWKLAEGHRIDLAVFDIKTTDEIVVDTNAGGRTTFKNAPRTSRRGGELAYLGQITPDWRATLSVTALKARFDEGFSTVNAGAAATVPAGNRLPGTPERSAFAELAWTPKGAWGGFNAGVEIVHTGDLVVDDPNSDKAPAATVLNLRAGFAQQAGGWRFRQLVRVDNATDKTYAGSVIVNEGNRRYFEPALPRNWTLGVTASYEFR